MSEEQTEFSSLEEALSYYGMDAALPRRSKFNNKRTEVDGIMFDSQVEAVQYGELLLRVRIGEIADLVCHPKFVLQESFRRDGKVVEAVIYIGDFGYTEFDTGRHIVEDVKGGKATRTAVFEVKRRLFLYKYPDIDLRIIET